MRVPLIVVTATLALTLTACGTMSSDDGKIREVEPGRNGVKLEVQDGTDPDRTYEVYVISSTVCMVDDYLRDCADDDDYLVPRPGARAGRGTTSSEPR